MRIECSGEVETLPSGAPVCVDVGGALLAWVSVPEFEVNLETVGEPFSWGYGVVAMCWALGKGVALVAKLVR